MCDYPFFIPQVVLFANSSLFWFKVTNEHREFRNYLFSYTVTNLLYRIFLLITSFQMQYDKFRRIPQTDMKCMRSKTFAYNTDFVAIPVQIT